MIYTIPKNANTPAHLRKLFTDHPQIKYVSLVGIDIYGNDTDEKIPVSLILDNLHEFLRNGVQTDGSSVLLPKIADISDAKIDIIPDCDSDWYVDYNYANIDEETGKPVGTLRIPAFLVHNNNEYVGSRIILKKALDSFETEMKRLLDANKYIFNYLPFKSSIDIDRFNFTCATEMEFYVKTPHESADKDRLHTSQEMKEQYWKRTIGPIRTALEKTIATLNLYGYNVEMGHKEVGGIAPQMMKDGAFDHIFEQLEIDWKYSDPMSTADKDMQARAIIKDCFRREGLDVTFMAKPLEGVAGSGKHTHFGVSVVLKSGMKVNLFTAADPDKDFMSPIGYGALMGLLKNYEIVNPFVSASNDAFNRLKPGYEAPVCTVTSLGSAANEAHRNRTVLACLIRDRKEPLATRFELRSPNPKSNTYLVLAAGYLAMLDGIKAALTAQKTPEELLASISKEFGQEDFYLEKDRVYRAENNIFSDYSVKERERLFGKSPATVWEALSCLDENPDKTNLLYLNDAFNEIDIESFKEAVLDQWATELKDRIVPEWHAFCAGCVRLDGESDDLDKDRWEEVEHLRQSIAKDTSRSDCSLSRIIDSIEKGKYEKASKLQVETAADIAKLEKLYKEYSKNIM